MILCFRVGEKFNIMLYTHNICQDIIFNFKTSVMFFTLGLIILLNTVDENIIRRVRYQFGSFRNWIFVQSSGGESNFPARPPQLVRANDSAHVKIRAIKWPASPWIYIRLLYITGEFRLYMICVAASQFAARFDPPRRGGGSGGGGENQYNIIFRYRP